MKQEYDAIARPAWSCSWIAPTWPANGPWGRSRPRRSSAGWWPRRLEALDYATRDIPPDRLRMHLCWGNYEGPHHPDIPLADIIDLVLAARPTAVSFEGANPRHEHEWKVFEEVKLPEGKV